MIVTIRCPNCGHKSQVEDMGDTAVCINCGRFIMSVSEEIRQQVLGPGQHQQGG